MIVREALGTISAVHMDMDIHGYTIYIHIGYFNFGSEMELRKMTKELA